MQCNSVRSNFLDSVERQIVNPTYTSLQDETPVIQHQSSNSRLGYEVTPTPARPPAVDAQLPPVGVDRHIFIQIADSQQQVILRIIIVLIFRIKSSLHYETNYDRSTFLARLNSENDINLNVWGFHASMRWALLIITCSTCNTDRHQHYVVCSEHKSSLWSMTYHNSDCRTHKCDVSSRVSHKYVHKTDYYLFVVW